MVAVAAVSPTAAQPRSPPKARERVRPAPRRRIPATPPVMHPVTPTTAGHGDGVDEVAVDVDAGRDRAVTPPAARRARGVGRRRPLRSMISPVDLTSRPSAGPRSPGPRSPGAPRPELRAAARAEGPARAVAGVAARRAMVRRAMVPRATGRRATVRRATPGRPRRPTVVGSRRRSLAVAPGWRRSGAAAGATAAVAAVATGVTSNVRAVCRRRFAGPSSRVLPAPCS